MTLPHAAIRFALGHPAISSVLLGAVSPAEVARNLVAVTVPIPARLWTDLKTEGLLDPRAPLPT